MARQTNITPCELCNTLPTNFVDIRMDEELKMAVELYECNCGAKKRKIPHVDKNNQISMTD